MTPEQAHIYLAGFSVGDLVLYSDGEHLRNATVAAPLHIADDGGRRLTVASTDRPIKHWPVRLAAVIDGTQRLVLPDPPLGE